MIPDINFNPIHGQATDIHGRFCLIVPIVILGFSLNSNEAKSKIIDRYKSIHLPLISNLITLHNSKLRSVLDSLQIFSTYTWGEVVLWSGLVS